MDSCDSRTRAYKNGKTFDQCKDIAQKMSHLLQNDIEKRGKVMWSDLLERVNHDELIYKLTLKYLKQDGYDIGNWKIPEIKK